MPNLDPNPRNQLGRGILDPVVEARLLAEGVVFAEFITCEDGHRFLGTCKRPWNEAVRDFARSLHPQPHYVFPKHQPGLKPELAAG